MSKSLRVGLLILVPLLLVVVVLVVLDLASRMRPAMSTMDSSYGLGLDYAESTGLSGGYSGSSNSASTKTVSRENAQFAPVSDESVERLIIKTGSLSLVVSDVNEVINKISKYAEENNGYVVTSNIYKRSLAPYGEVTVRIPVGKFDQGFTDVKGYGDLVSERIDGRDVTEEYVDLDAQLGNLKSTETQFLDIMKRAVKIEDVLAVQRELSNVRREIERIYGRMYYLRQSADLATLTVNLSTDPDVLPTLDDKDSWKPLAVLKSAVRGMVEVVKFLANLFIWVIVFVPVWLVIVVLIWFINKIFKKRKNNNQRINLNQ